MRSSGSFGSADARAARRRGARNRSRPTAASQPAVRRELGGVEAEAVLRVRHACRSRRAPAALARQAAHRRAHGVALLQQPDHAPAADEARPAGHQNRSLSAHRRSFAYSCLSNGPILRSSDNSFHRQGADDDPVCADLDGRRPEFACRRGLHRSRAGRARRFAERQARHRRTPRFRRPHRAAPSPGIPRRCASSSSP